MLNKFFIICSAVLYLSFQQPVQGDEKDLVIQQLYEIGAIQFGEFKLKSGIMSPIYVDMRKTISHPEVFQNLLNQACQKLETLSCDHICGVPYGAIPMATGIAIHLKKPTLLVRKETKDYGNKKLIEGNYQKGDNVIVIEDVVTTGSSVTDIVKTLKDAELSVPYVVALLDREQGGAARMAKEGISLQSVLTIDEALDSLYRCEKISEQQWRESKDWLNEQRNPKPVAPTPTLSFRERGELSSNTVSSRLFSLMDRKKTNLAIAADVTTKEELLKIADTIGPEICVLKTHIDIIEDFDNDLVEELKALSEKHDFLLFEDRKFADIGNTVKLQFEKGIYRISEWADLITVHALPGPDIIKALKMEGKGIVLLPQMSSKGNLATGAYTTDTLKMVEENADSVIGVICREKLLSKPNFLHLTPGVNLESKGDALGQQYLTVEEAIVNKGTDIVIVGRGIYQAEDPQATAALYRKAAWDSYEKVLNR